jgi:hypothetical protein
MAKVHNLPPQAYTRDTLVKAIDWVATQSQTTRERASSADALVSLYLQSRRRANEWQNEAPASAENFRTDLKNLAEDLKQFEEPSVPPQVNHVHNVPVHEARYDHYVAPAPQYHQPVRPPARPADPPPPPKAPPVISGWVVDDRTLSAAKEIQVRLNLSSDTEALRFLVTLGIERARQLFGAGQT